MHRFIICDVCSKVLMFFEMGFHVLLLFIRSEFVIHVIDMILTVTIVDLNLVL